MYKDYIEQCQKDIERKKTQVKILIALDKLETLTFDELVNNSYGSKVVNGKIKYRMFRLAETRRITANGLTMNIIEDEFQTNITTERGRDLILQEFKNKIKTKLLTEYFVS
jgi:hypothetical protein